MWALSLGRLCWGAGVPASASVGQGYPGGAFAFKDPFGIKPIYHDLDGLIATLQADGLASLEFVWLDDVVRVLPLLRPIAGRPGILYGVK